MTIMHHPAFPTVTQTVPDEHIKAWQTAGWIPDPPPQAVDPTPVSPDDGDKPAGSGRRRG